MDQGDETDEGGGGRGGRRRFCRFRGRCFLPVVSDFVDGVGDSVCLSFLIVVVVVVVVRVCVVVDRSSRFDR